MKATDRYGTVKTVGRQQLWDTENSGKATDSYGTLKTVEIRQQTDSRGTVMPKTAGHCQPSASKQSHKRGGGGGGGGES